MVVYFLAGFICFIQCSYVSTDTTVVKMDKDDNSCGTVTVLDPAQEVRLKAKGLSPGGYCGVTIFTPKEVGKYACDAICVTFKTASISTCEVKVKFVGHKFRSDGDMVREFNCHQQNKEPFCWDVESMRVEVVESYNYAYVNQKPLYELDLDVHSRCTKDSIKKDYAAHLAARQKNESNEKQTYIEGIAVGLSLACVFLVVLFIAWCYTKNQAVSGGSSNSGPRSESRQTQPKKKGNIISTFRKKLHIKPKNAQSSPEEPEAIYRKKDSSATAQPSARDSEVTIPLTKESDHETFELANETLADGDKARDGEDSPKDGGADGSTLDPPEVVIVPGTPLPPEED